MPSIPKAALPRLWPYFGGIARENGFEVLEAGGMPDHAHLLLSLPSRISLAKAVQLVKAGSSKWIHDSFDPQRHFSWQEKFGGFTIGISQIDATRRYIQNQEQHHRKITFHEEFGAFLKKHGLIAAVMSAGS